MQIDPESLATLFLELEFAIYAGMLLSLVLYLSRTAHPRIVNLATPNNEAYDPSFIEAETECPYLKVIRIDVPLFFGAISHVGGYLHNIDKYKMHKRTILTIRCGINFSDIAGAELLAREAQRRRMQRGNLYLCTPSVSKIFLPRKKMRRPKLILLADNLACRFCKNPPFKECRIFRQSLDSFRNHEI